MPDAALQLCSDAAEPPHGKIIAWVCAGAPSGRAPCSLAAHRLIAIAASQLVRNDIKISDWKFHAKMSSSPVVVKSDKFCVASRAPSIRAMAAIIRSGAVGVCRRFDEAKDPIGKAVAPIGQAAVQPGGSLIRVNILDAESISAIVTAGSPNSASFRTRQATTAGSGVLRSVSETTLVSRKIKVPARD